MTSAQQQFIVVIVTVLVPNTNTNTNIHIFINSITCFDGSTRSSYLFIWTMFYPVVPPPHSLCIKVIDQFRWTAAPHIMTSSLSVRSIPDPSQTCKNVCKSAPTSWLQSTRSIWRPPSESTDAKEQTMDSADLPYSRSGRPTPLMRFRNCIRY